MSDDENECEHDDIDDGKCTECHQFFDYVATGRVHALVTASRAMRDRIAELEESIESLQSELNTEGAALQMSRDAIQYYCDAERAALARADAAQWQAFASLWLVIGENEKWDRYADELIAARDAALARAAAAERDEAAMREALRQARNYIERLLAEHETTVMASLPKLVAYVEKALDAARRETTIDACGTCGSPTCEGTHMKTDREGHGKLCPFPSLPCCCRIAPAPKVSE